MLDLEPGTKATLKSTQHDHGYKYIEGDREFFHWSGKSRDLVSQQRFGQESDIGMLRSRLMGLGADILCSIFQCEAGLKLPAPVVHRAPRPRHHSRVFLYPNGTADGEYTQAGPLSMISPDEKNKCDQWLYRGLTSTDVSLLSAFRYVTKPGPLHCEGHKEKGLLTIVLNPRGLDALVDGKWVPMDVDEQGRPLGLNCAVVFPGLTLEKATGGVIRATEHRVRNKGSAFSFFCQPTSASDANQISLYTRVSVVGLADELYKICELKGNNIYFELHYE